jgi:hypothetical protein
VGWVMVTWEDFLLKGVFGVELPSVALSSYAHPYSSPPPPTPI